jgi:hypothetical protein
MIRQQEKAGAVTGPAFLRFVRRRAGEALKVLLLVLPPKPDNFADRLPRHASQYYKFSESFAPKPQTLPPEHAALFSPGSTPDLVPALFEAYFYTKPI